MGDHTLQVVRLGHQGVSLRRIRGAGSWIALHPLEHGPGGRSCGLQVRVKMEGGDPDDGVRCLVDGLLLAGEALRSHCPWVSILLVLRNSVYFFYREVRSIQYCELNLSQASSAGIIYKIQLESIRWPQHALFISAF